MQKTEDDYQTLVDEMKIEGKFLMRTQGEEGREILDLVLVDILSVEPMAGFL